MEPDDPFSGPLGANPVTDGQLLWDALMAATKWRDFQRAIHALSEADLRKIVYFKAYEEYTGRGDQAGR